MKTNNLKRSFLQSMILMATAMFAGTKRPHTISSKPQREGGRFWNPQAIFIPRHGKFKGWMRERRRSTFNKNK